MPTCLRAFLLLTLLTTPACLTVQNRGAGLEIRRAQLNEGEAPRPEWHPDAATELPWPARWGRGPGELQGIILPVDGPPSALVPVRLPKGSTLEAGPRDHADVRLLAHSVGADRYAYALESDGAVVFAYRRGTDPANAPPEPGRTAFAFISAQLVSDGAPANEHAEQEHEEHELTIRSLQSLEDGSLVVNFEHPNGPFFVPLKVRDQSANPAPEPPKPAPTPIVEIQRTWFTFSEPTRGQPRGVVLLVPGMFGTPEPVVTNFEANLRRRGWCVLRMLSHPSRFTERLVLDIDLDDPEASARLVAETLTGRAAEAAYAAEAAFAHVYARNPELTILPRIAVGMSGGAMILPTIIAREPWAYHGAVFIAGAVDFFSTTHRSNYAQWIDAVHFRFTPANPPPQLIDNFTRHYLRNAPLDSYHLAPRLAPKPALVIHAAADRAVPADLGDELWKRLGQPERWSYRVGHEILFLMLSGRFNTIIDWIDKATTPDD